MPIANMGSINGLCLVSYEATLWDSALHTLLWPVRTLEIVLELALSGNDAPERFPARLRLGH